MVRLLALADLHLDSPFRGLAQARAELAETLRDASLRALDTAVELAVALAAERRLDAVAFLGDVFDQHTPSLRARRRFSEALTRLTDAGLACWLVAGNHDPVAARGVWARVALPAGAHLFGTAWECLPLYRNGALVAEVVGRSFGAGDLDSEALAGLPPAAGAPLRVGLLHADVDGRGDEQAYAPVKLAALRASGCEAWLLGHLHAGAVLSAEPLVAYAGTPQGRDLGPGEVGVKGGLLVELEPGRPARTSWLPLAPVRLARLTVDVAGCGDEVAVAARVRAALAAEAAQAPCDGLLARVVLSGPAVTLALWQALAQPARLAELAAEAEDPRAVPFLLVERVLNETLGPLPEPAWLRGCADLLGDFVRLVDEARQPESAVAGAVATALASFERPGVAAFADLALDPAELLTQAETLVLAALADRLGQEDGRAA